LPTNWFRHGSTAAAAGSHRAAQQIASFVRVSPTNLKNDDDVVKRLKALFSICLELGVNSLIWNLLDERLAVWKWWIGE
jgi:hypothetical protein